MSPVLHGLLRSKHHAALFLHYALEQNPQKDFRFMWNFSSTSVYGNMGQLNYSGSNSFLDVLTRHRKVPQTRMRLQGWRLPWSSMSIHLFIHLFIAAAMSRASSLYANPKFEDFFCRVSCHGQRTWTVNWKMYIFARLCVVCVVLHHLQSPVSRRLNAWRLVSWMCWGEGKTIPGNSMGCLGWCWHGRDHDGCHAIEERDLPISMGPWAGQTGLRGPQV